MVGKERKGRRAIDGHRMNGRLRFIQISDLDSFFNPFMVMANFIFIELR
jgi:hypothetical protein